MLEAPSDGAGLPVKAGTTTVREPFLTKEKFKPHARF
jgi:hypothetical protein